MNTIAQRVKNVFERFKEKKVVIVGDIMIDRYLFGQSNRMSAEAPVPIWDVGTIEDRLGGAANVATNIKQLGGEPILVSVIGDDEDGYGFLKLLKENGLNPSGVGLDSNRKTTIKTRFVSQNHQIFRFDNESRHDLDDRMELTLIDRFFNILDEQQPAVIILQDYNKGILTPKVIANIVHYSKRRNIPVAVDPKFKNFMEYQGCTLFKPNLNEASYYLQNDLVNASEKEWIQGATALRQAIECDYTVLTLSDKGMLMIDNNDDPIYLPAYKRTISDVSGAGDTVISILACGLAMGEDMTAFAELANIGGGLVCEKPGVEPIVLEELIVETDRIFEAILPDPPIVENVISPEPQIQTAPVQTTTIQEPEPIVETEAIQHIQQSVQQSEQPVFVPESEPIEEVVDKVVQKEEINTVQEEVVHEEQKVQEEQIVQEVENIEEVQELELVEFRPVKKPVEKEDKFGHIKEEFKEIEETEQETEPHNTEYHSESNENIEDDLNNVLDDIHGDIHDDTNKDTPDDIASPLLEEGEPTPFNPAEYHDSPKSASSDDPLK